MRAQVTFFMLIGILLLAVVGVIFFFISSTMQKPDTVHAVDLKAKAQLCLEQVASSVLTKVAANGGELEPTNFVTYNKHPVVYGMTFDAKMDSQIYNTYYPAYLDYKLRGKTTALFGTPTTLYSTKRLCALDGSNNQNDPVLGVTCSVDAYSSTNKSIQRDLEKAILMQVQTCINEPAVTYENVSVTFTKSNVVVTLPTQGKTADVASSLGTLKVTLPYRYLDLYKAAFDVVSFYRAEIDSLQIQTPPGITIKKIRDPNFNDAMIVSISDGKIEWNVAIANRPPIIVEPRDKITMTSGQTVEVTFSAFDPDEKDIVTYVVPTGLNGFSYKMTTADNGETKIIEMSTSIEGDFKVDFVVTDLAGVKTTKTIDVLVVAAAVPTDP